MRAFADALDAIPMALAENSGLSPIETLANIKSRQAKEKNSRLGVDCMFTGSNGKSRLFPCSVDHSRSMPASSLSLSTSSRTTFALRLVFFSSSVSMTRYPPRMVPCCILVCPSFPSPAPPWDGLQHNPTLYLHFLPFFKSLMRVWRHILISETHQRHRLRISRHVEITLATFHT
jgi:hypothetical protein